MKKNKLLQTKTQDKKIKRQMMNLQKKVLINQEKK